MDVDELDATILSHARHRWLKAGMAAAQTMPEFGPSLTEAQLEIVVARGHLVAQGNLSRPRFSEARRPGNEGAERAAGQDFRQ